MSRFDSIAFDIQSEEAYEIFKKKYEDLGSLIEMTASDRAAALALTSLEESFMWLGKSIRNWQLSRTPVKEASDE